jgi:hypothetical protein
VTRQHDELWQQRVFDRIERARRRRWICAAALVAIGAAAAALRWLRW